MITEPPPEDIVIFLFASVVFITGVYKVPLVAIPVEGAVTFTSSNLFGAVVPMPTLPYQE